MTDEYTPAKTVPRGYKWMKPGERYGEVVLIDRLSTRRWLCSCDCGREFIAVGSHLRAGVTKSCGHWRAERNAQSYNAIHLRLNRVLGRASDRACAECGVPATAWAYNRSGVGETTTIRGGYEVAYSTDESQYDPCCGPCHYRRDHRA